jgi:predicted hydrocarbon binding protein
MHGIILAELQKFGTARFGAAGWTQVRDKAGLGSKTYLVSKTYPDAEAMALVSAAAAVSGTPVGALLEDFGEFIVPGLLAIYGPLVKKEWKTLDLIEHTEETIHKVVRLQNPGAAPPALVTQRPSAQEVVITYTSTRKMCGVAKGIARGIAAHFKEGVAISESTCMLRGDPACAISIRLTP